MPEPTSPVVGISEDEIVGALAARVPPGVGRRGWRCLSDEQLACYVDGSLGPVDKARFENHLSGCRFCLAAVAASMRQQASSTVAQVPPALVRRAADLVPEKGSGRRTWRWLLAPAMATLVVTSAVLLRSPEPARFTPPPLDGPAIKEAQPEIPRPNASAAAVRHSTVRSIRPINVGVQLLEPGPGVTVGRASLRFRWHAVKDASYYNVRVANAEGDLVWEAQSSSTSAQPPAALAIRPGKHFVWVQAHLTDGRMLKSEAVEFIVGSSN